MACVLTVVVVNDGHAIAGHVGDTRLYKLRDGRIDKVTRDHSPVGEREDAHEISELEAMRHPRRNEVYRDVGSDAHEPGDPDFIDLHEIPFEPDAALLLCSDGLTDLIDSSAIQQIVERSAGRPQQVVKAIDRRRQCRRRQGQRQRRLRRRGAVRGQRRVPPGTDRAARRTTTSQIVRAGVDRAAGGGDRGRRRTACGRIGRSFRAREIGLPLTERQRHHVGEGESIAAALQRAEAGSTVVVEPGEYRETLALKDGVRLVSRVPRGATIRLPGTGVRSGSRGRRRRRDRRRVRRFPHRRVTPRRRWAPACWSRHSDVAIVDVEVTGAVSVAIAYQ